jgi:hypothetical protein
MKPSFASKFSQTILNEEDRLPSEEELIKLGQDSMEDAPEKEEAAWKDSLEPGVSPKDFDVENNPMIKIDREGVEAAKKWVGQLEEIADFINGTGENSLNFQINKLELNNSIPFKGLIRREEKRITKVAENLRGLAEVLKNLIVSSEKKISDSIRR